LAAAAAPASETITETGALHMTTSAETGAPSAAATSSKYGLSIYAAKRARQINDYYAQLGEGLLEYVGPLVEPLPKEKPLSIALREINAGLLTHTEGE
jgi:DNA-directed RNA polymerase subunit omega